MRKLFVTAIGFLLCTSFVSIHAKDAAAPQAAVEAAKEVAFNKTISTTETVRYKMDTQGSGQAMQMILSIAPSAVSETQMTARYTFEKCEFVAPSSADKAGVRMMKAVGDSFKGLTFEARNTFGGGNAELLNRPELDAQIKVIEDKLVDALRSLGEDDKQKDMFATFGRLMFAPMLKAMPENMIKSLNSTSNGVSLPLRGKYTLNQTMPISFEMPLGDGRGTVTAKGEQRLSTTSVDQQFELQTNATLAESELKRLMSAQFASNPLTKNSSVEGGTMNIEATAKIDTRSAWPIELLSKVKIKTRLLNDKQAKDLDQTIIFNMQRLD
jgi:hypothetical protein